MVGADLGDLARELRSLNKTVDKNMQVIARLMAIQVREQRAANAIMMRAYKLSWEQVKDEDEESRRKWA